QNDEKGIEHVICYTSKGTNKEEQNYEAMKIECLAVKWAIQHFNYYLAGRHFTVIMDHSALKWLFSKKEPSGQYTRWIAALQEYDFEVQYWKGRIYQNVDALSRIPYNGAQGRVQQ